jgi:hypothetical protein
MISFAIGAGMPVQANAAIRLKGSADDYHSDDAVNRSQHVDKMGGLKHDSHPSVVHYTPGL